MIVKAITFFSKLSEIFISLQVQVPCSDRLEAAFGSEAFSSVFAAHDRECEFYTKFRATALKIPKFYACHTKNVLRTKIEY